MEATRRVVGVCRLPIIALIAIGYFFAGEFLPGQFYYNRGDFSRFVYEITYRSNGTFSDTDLLPAQFVFYTVWGNTGIDRCRKNVYRSCHTRGFGKYKGGPAKASVVANWNDGKYFREFNCQCGNDRNVYNHNEK